MLDGWEQECKEALYSFINQEQYIPRHKIGEKNQSLILMWNITKRMMTRLSSLS